MADWNAKTATPDTSITDDNSGLIGGDSQSATTPSWYSFDTIKAWVKSWIAKADVGLGNVANSLQLVASNNLSDLPDAAAAIVNSGAFAKLFKTYVAGRYYLPLGYAASGTSTLSGANRIHFFPFYVPQKITISTLMVRTATGGAGNWQGAIYASHATTCLPTGNPLAQSASSASTAGNNTNVDSAFSLNVQLLPGTLYWMAFNSDTGTPTFIGLSTTSLTSFNAQIGSTVNSDVIGGAMGGVYNAQTLGTWPDVTALSFYSTPAVTIPLISFKVASVP